MSVLWAGVIIASTTQAQTASQIAPREFHPPITAPNTQALPALGATDAPEGSQDLIFEVGQVTVEDGFADMAGSTEALVAPLRHQRVSVAQIFAVAQTLEQSYANAGYILARVVVPQQDLVDGGTVRLVVIDGYFEAIDTTALPQTVRATVASRLAGLKDARQLTLAKIERQLLLAGDTPGITLRSTLAPGSQPGATILLVEGRYRATGQFLSLDNSLSTGLGRYQAGGGIDLNSSLGWGEKLYARAYGDPFDGAKGFGGALPRNRAFNFGATVPVGHDGLTVTLDVTNARATPQSEPGQLAFTSDFHRTSLRLDYPVVRARALTLNTQVAFDSEQEQLDVIASELVPISLDRLRVLRLGGDGEWAFAPGISVSGNLTASVGLSGLGARRAKDATPLLPLSRQGADADFRKLEGMATYRQALSSRLALEVKAHGQLNFGQALSRIEQIGLTGPDCLSTSQSGTLQGDSGACLRAELQAPIDVSLNAHFVSIKPYLFAAHAKLWVAEPSALERPRLQASVLGLGLKIAASRASRLSGAGIGFEFGHEFRNGGPTEPDRLRLSSWLQF